MDPIWDDVSIPDESESCDPTIRDYDLFPIKDYSDFVTSLKREVADLTCSNFHVRISVINNLCFKIFSEINQIFIDEWIKENPLSARDLLIPVKELVYHNYYDYDISSDRLSIILARAQCAIKQSWKSKWTWPLFDDALRFVTDYLDAPSILNLSLSNKTLNKSKVISAALLGKEYSQWESHSTFFYRNLFIGGTVLRHLFCHSSGQNRHLNELLDCVQKSTTDCFQSLILVKPERYSNGRKRLCRHNDRDKRLKAGEGYLFPDRLTRLVLDTKVSDINIGRLPRQLTQLSINSFYITEAGLRNLPLHLTQLHIQNINKSLAPKNLPKEITYLSLTFNSQYYETKQRFSDIDWPPNLSKLEIKSFGECLNRSRIDKFGLIKLPGSLEKLKINAWKLIGEEELDFRGLFNCQEMSLLFWRKMDPTLISQLPVTLQKLQTIISWESNNIHFDHLTNLKDLLLGSSWYESYIDNAMESFRLPSSLTTLRLLKVFPDRIDLQSFANLKSFCIYAQEESGSAKFGSYFKLKTGRLQLPNSLKYLRLSARRTINSETFIELPRELKSLVVFLENYNSLHIKHLPPVLEDLYLYCAHIDPNDIRNLPSSLKHLSLSRGYSDSKKFNAKSIDNLANLETLEITNFEIDSKQLNLLCLKKLRKVIFNFSTFSLSRNKHELSEYEEGSEAPYLSLFNTPSESIDLKDPPIENPDFDKRCRMLEIEEARQSEIDLLNEWKRNQPFEVEIRMYLSHWSKKRPYHSTSTYATRKSLRELDERAGVLIDEKELDISICDEFAYLIV